MRKWILLIALCSSLAPAIASAQPEINCKSAKRPNVDLKTYLETCDARAASERAASGRSAGTAAAAAATVSASRTTVAGLSFANVPTWSNADILAQFPLTRDKRYMTTTSNPSFQRRISWMYPEDGCFSRAEQVNVQVAQAGKVKPYKLYAFGNLRVYTENTPSGLVEWGWHVVPVVKNSAGEPIVFDAALSPCRPLPWKDWLEMMVDDLSDLDNVASGWGVALGDANAYWTSSLVSGEPSHSAESLAHQKNDYLPLEWNRQIELGRDPNVVLGSNPPWGGYKCVSGEERRASTTLAPSATQTLTVTCPFGTLATGGGISAPRGLSVTRNSKTSGNGWSITARNNTSSNAQLDVSAVCLTGAPSTASVTTVTGTPNSILPNLSGSSSASCASGTLVGGGYLTTGTSSVMRVYNNRRSTSTGSTWQVSAQNTTTSSKSITAYAYCLANTSFTFNQVAGAGVYDGGFSMPTCTPKKMMGGGYTFPRTSNYHVDYMGNFGPEIYLVAMDGAPASADPNAVGYAECLTHP